MLITYIEKGIPHDFKRIDHIRTIKVLYKAFESGELIYFKRNEYEYFVIGKNDIIEVTQ